MDNELLHQYTRAQALADGVLIDISAVAKAVGFQVPVAVTARVWHDFVVPPVGLSDAQGQSIESRLWDLVYLLSVASANQALSSSLVYSVLFLMGTDEHQLVNLRAVVHPGDRLEPVVTVLLTTED
jgi:hypothetical protein